MKYFFFLIFCCLTALQAVNAQSSKTAPISSKVFMMGEEEKKYEAILQQYSLMLLQVCNNSMEETYDHWNNMLKDMENFAKAQNFDLKGIKIWINVFWKNDGRIDYIVYHPKPNSRNINYQDLSQFFISFQNQYQLPLKGAKNFSHYGSASFPIFNKAHLLQEK